MIHYNTIQVPQTCIHKPHKNANPCPREPAPTTFTPGRAHRSNTYIGKQLSEEGSPSSTTPPPRSREPPHNHSPAEKTHWGSAVPPPGGACMPERVLMQVIPLDQAHTRCRSDRACRRRREAVGLMGEAERAERAETVGEERSGLGQPTTYPPPSTAEMRGRADSIFLVACRSLGGWRGGRG
jgi:hypothetical protein